MAIETVKLDGRTLTLDTDNVGDAIALPFLRLRDWAIANHDAKRGPKGFRREPGVDISRIPFLVSFYRSWGYASQTWRLGDFDEFIEPCAIVGKKLYPEYYD